MGRLPDCPAGNLRILMVSLSQGLDEPVSTLLLPCISLVCTSCIPWRALACISLYLPCISLVCNAMHFNGQFVPGLRWARLNCTSSLYFLGWNCSVFPWFAVPCISLVCTALYFLGFATQCILMVGLFQALALLSLHEPVWPNSFSGKCWLDLGFPYWKCPLLHESESNKFCSALKLFYVAKFLPRGKKLKELFWR